jgi:biotin synthase
MNLHDLLRKSRNEEEFSRDEIIQMLSYAPTSPESMSIMGEARRVSEETTGGKAEVHGQFALDLAPCARNCEWCSFAAKNGVFREKWQIDVPQAVEFALKFQNEGANAILTMTTADYPLGKLLEIGAEIRRNIEPDLPLIANTGDKTLEQARRMKEAGYDGVYHALRLDEGRKNNLDPQQRLETIRNFQEAGLWVCTCVEPVGPEHTNEYLAAMIRLTASMNPAFSGAARRIPVPGTSMAELGIISELRMAQIVAVTRLAMPRAVRGNCTHEPCTLGALGGASIFWAEIGANPRDDQENTEESRGQNVDDCREIYEETDWKVLDGPSRHFTGAPEPTAPSLELAMSEGLC